jgi:hypothetical protein
LTHDYPVRVEPQCCSPTAAANLRNALDAALKMLEQLQANAVATTTMN